MSTQTEWFHLTSAEYLSRIDFQRNESEDIYEIVDRHTEGHSPERVESWIWHRLNGAIVAVSVEMNTDDGAPWLGYDHWEEGQYDGKPMPDPAEGVIRPKITTHVGKTTRILNWANATRNPTALELQWFIDPIPGNVEIELEGKQLRATYSDEDVDS
jgi:hypothetical protein